MICDICKKEKGNEIRLGVCWPCAEAETIIHDGLDMHDWGPHNDKTPARTPMEKLKFLIKKGWHIN